MTKPAHLKTMSGFLLHLGEKAKAMHAAESPEQRSRDHAQHLREMGVPRLFQVAAALEEFGSGNRRRTKRKSR
jgi:hypothetical protein